MTSALLISINGKLHVERASMLPVCIHHVQAAADQHNDRLALQSLSYGLGVTLYNKKILTKT